MPDVTLKTAQNKFPQTPLQRDLNHFWENQREFSFVLTKAVIKIGKLFPNRYLNETTPLLATFTVLKTGDDILKIKGVLHTTLGHLSSLCDSVKLTSEGKFDWKAIAISVIEVSKDVFQVIMWVSDHPVCYLFSVTPVLQMTAGVGIGVTMVAKNILRGEKFDRNNFIKQAVSTVFVTITKGKMVGKAITLAGICLSEKNLKLAQIGADVAVGALMHVMTNKSCKLFPYTTHYIITSEA
jgi:hypothetical protein